MDPLSLLREQDPAAVERILKLKEAGKPRDAWAWLCRNRFRPGDSVDVHLALYRWVYDLTETDGYPAPAWIPDDKTVEEANIAALCRELSVDGPKGLHRWSLQNRCDFWSLLIRKLGIRFDVPPSAALDVSGGPEFPQWLPGARLNCAASCFNAPPEQTAIIVGHEDGSLTRFSYGDLHSLANRVANGLRAWGIKEGDAVAIAMPMTIEAIAAYLGVVLAGGAVVSVADSFASEEIALRLRISNTRLVFTQNAIRRAGKEIPLFERIEAAGDWPAVVFNAPGTSPPDLREMDATWEKFLSEEDAFTPVSRRPDDAINILFSSGTTGTPKAIPWDHTTPIKCATDGFIHHDLHPGDVACWPTNLGWMMGPWLIFAAMLNRCALAIFDGAPQQKEFCRFVEKAQVNLLGVIPSLVRAWRDSGLLDDADWRSVRAFSSTGECSNPADMFHLMSRAGFRPVIEYCGGTEIGGGYLSGTVVEPAAPGAFTMPACGIDLVLLDDDGHPATKGEVFLAGPSIGLSTRLLNADHHAAYFAETPHDEDGRLLRRHGDHAQALGDGSFRMLGRHDDTMNLGGIKVGSVEIERAISTVPAVHEAAAVASGDGGPSRLIVFVVPNSESFTTVAELEAQMQKAIRERLNPLFKISEVRLVESLPRTASNKIMRRLLK